MIRYLIGPLVLALAVAPAAGAQSAKPSEQQTKPSEQQTKTLNLSAYAELLRSDVRVQKVAVITELMGFTEAEDAAFWPIIGRYDAEMSKLGDERVALVAEYARNYEQLSDEVAERLARRALDSEARRQAVKTKCYERVRAALKPRTALRFLQIEHQLLLLTDLEISAALPIADK